MQDKFLPTREKPNFLTLERETKHPPSKESQLPATHPHKKVVHPVERERTNQKEQH